MTPSKLWSLRQKTVLKYLRNKANASLSHFADILSFPSSTAKEGQVQHYGDLPGTANNHLGIKKTSHYSELT